MRDVSSWLRPGASPKAAKFLSSLPRAGLGDCHDGVSRRFCGTAKVRTFRSRKQTGFKSLSRLFG
jgi:hypothetical protein